MASRIQGITIEIGGDTTKLQSSLKGVDKSLKSTQSVLKDVNKLLKLDPTNTELLRQKQVNLAKAIEATKNRLAQLKEAQKGVKEGTPEWDNLQREIIATEQELKAAEKEYKNFGSIARQVVKAAGDKMQEFGGKVEEAGKKLQPLSTAATGVLSAIGGLAYKSITAADDLNTLSKQTGISTDELQKMQYAADLVDVSVDDITSALKKLKPKITEDNAALAELGVATTNADGSLRDATDVFYDALEALSQISNETERDQKAMELFGKGADSLAGIIDDGGAALHDFGKEAEDLGLIIDEDTLDALNNMNDTIDKTKATVGASFAEFGATAATVLAPALEKVAGFIGQLTEKLRNLTPEQTETIMKILGIVAAIAPILIIGGKLIKMVGMITSVMSGLNPVTLVIMAVVAAGILLYKNWDKIKAKAQEIAGKIKETWDNIKTGVTNAVNALKTGVTNAWNGIKTGVTNAVNTLKTNVTNRFNSIKSTAVNVFNSVKSAASNVWSSITSTITEKINAAKTAVQNAVDKIKGFFKFDWELPKLKLPHIKLEKGKWPWGIMGEGEAPKVRIEWYKKAYQNPVMFTSPTVMATPSGAKGFGDGHGAEIVMGLNKLRELVGSSGVVINVYASEGMDVNALADKIQARFVAMNNQRRAAYA